VGVPRASPGPAAPGHLYGAHPAFWDVLRGRLRQQEELTVLHWYDWRDVMNCVRSHSNIPDLYVQTVYVCVCGGVGGGIDEYN